jgi:hypothetical protein
VAEPAAVEAPAIRPLPQRILQLQRAVGNGAVAGLLGGAEAAGVQRKVRFRSFTVDDRTWETYRKGLSDAHTQVEKARKWDATTAAEVWQKMVDMIESDLTFPTAGTFARYRDFVVAAAKQVDSGVVEVTDDLVDPVEPMVLAQRPRRSKAFDFRTDMEEDLLTVIHDESSSWRKEDQMDSDLEDELQVPFSRRRGDEKNTMDRDDVQPVSFASFSGEVRGGRSHLLTHTGGGRGPDYADLWQQVLNAAALSGTGEGDVSVTLLNLLEKGTFPDLPATALKALDVILAIILNAEMSRATSSVVHFAATVYHVWKNGGSFVAAVSGKDAVYLGANEGGAQLLRGNVPDGMEKQQQRASSAAETYLARFISGKDDPEERIREIAAALTTNLLSYKRARTAKLLE